MKQLQRFSILTLLILGACVVPYEFESESFGDFLVVDGILTNETKHHQVTLTRTRPIASTDTIYESGATVYIQDSQGNQFPYQEIESGLYESILSFGGQIGESYQLMITTDDGTTVASKATTMLASVPIDTVYGRYAELPSLELDRVVGGIQFFLDANASSGTAEHFRYEWEETWKIKVPYRSYYIYEGPGVNNCADNPYPPREENVGECFDFGESQDVLIATSKENVDGNVLEFPISFVDQENDRLSIRYSMLIKQYSINEETYSYYKRIKENNESSGSLFDQQKGAIIGNLESTNSNETILGYFDVAGVTHKRVFFSAFDFEAPFKRPLFRFQCNEQNQSVMTISTGELDEIMSRNRDGLWLLANNPCNPEGETLLAKFFCADCTTFATNDVPDYWIE